MAFWKKLFGKNFEETVEYAEDLLKSGQPGEARLEFENALAKGKNASKEQLLSIRARIIEAQNMLSRAHADEGKAFAEKGDLDRAVECFETAIEVAGDDDIRREVQLLIDGLEADDARAAYAEAEEMTDEERFQILSGGWETERAVELESYGEPFKEAFLALHNGRAKEASEALTELAEGNKDALYLFLELGMARRNAGLHKEAIESLQTFLQRMKEEDEAIAEEREAEADENDEDEEEEEDEEILTPEARVQARAALAEIFLEHDDAEAAEDELRALVELLPDKSGPYVHLGAFLRGQDRFEESMDVLEQGHRHMGEIRPDMRVVREIGLTQKALGKNKDAIASLKSVIGYSAALRDYNFDPNTALPLAELYEDEGELGLAADLYRHLTSGSHARGHYEYNKEAGRLLIATDEIDLARRHLTRAQELATTDEDREVITEMVSDLNKPGSAEN